LKILVTGGSGFIGTNFISKALIRGHIIYNIDNLSLFQKDNNKKNKNYTFEKVDVRHRQHLTEVINKFKPNKVIHMAAESHVDNSILNPDNFITTNIIGTYNILQASLEFFKSKNSENNFCFHHVSTDEVYGSLEKNENAFIEDSKYKPNSPYSASKAGSDHLVRAWQKTYDLPCIITSCTNNFGPFQHPEKLMPVVIINGILKNKIPIYGTGKNIRDWIYVEDHVEALIIIMEKNLRNKTYLIGSNNEKENIETVDTICKVLDKVWDTSYSHQDLKFFVKDRLGHDFRYSINSNLIKKEIRWKAKIDFKNGILKTVNWYLKNETWWNKLINKV
tara:strand:+ start:529 stop:1530 length:1002 start_codon:yes stop_codon:yes gene_type:complete